MGNPFESRTFNPSESIDNLETLNLSTSPYKNAKRVVLFNSAGNAIANGLNLTAWDYMARTLTNSTTETYVFKTGGSGGTTTNTVVIVYTDSTLATISTVTKT